MTWQTSSFCTSSSCVEVNIAEQVAVRDTHGAQHTITRDAWADLIAHIKASELDV